MHQREKSTNYKEYLTYNLLWETTLKQCHEYVERKEQLFLKLSALSREEEQEEHPRIIGQRVREILCGTAAKSEPAVKKPGMFSSFCAVELPKPQPPKPAASAWDFLKYREPVAKGAKPAPLSGMVRNADGLFYVTRAGKRIRVTEGSVNPTDRSPA